MVCGDMDWNNLLIVEPCVGLVLLISWPSEGLSVSQEELPVGSVKLPEDTEWLYEYVLKYI
jgi:hypothetical protein